MSKWKIGIIIAAVVIVITGIILASIYINEIIGYIAAALGIGGSYAAIKKQQIKQIKKDDMIITPTPIRRDTINNIPEDRNIPMGKPDDAGYVQVPLDPSVKEEPLKKEDIPVGVKESDINTITIISNVPKPEEIKPDMSQDDKEAGKTINHFESKLTRKSRGSDDT